MMETTAPQSRIWQFLGELGWPHDQVADNVIRAEYGGHFGTVKVMLQTNEQGLRMAINPVLEHPSAGWGKSVSHLVKLLNDEARMIRIGLDSDGDIYVKVELPSQSLDFDQFVYVLFNLCQVSEQLIVPVLQAEAYDTYVP